jgi:hypothetical protein
VGVGARSGTRSDYRPSGEKLSVTLQQAGYLGSGKAHAFQVFRVLMAIGLANPDGRIRVARRASPPGMVGR